jgi:hypothetical protein
MDRRGLSKELFKLAHERTDSAIEIMNEFLVDQARHLPDKLPGVDELKLLDREAPEGDHWIKHFPPILSALKALVLSDTESGRNFAKAFKRNFSKKYGDSQSGKLLLDALTREIEESQRSVEHGLAPWMIGWPSEDRE